MGEVDDETLEYVEEILEEIADAIGVEADVEVEDGDDAVEAEFVGDDVALLIGRHGQTLDAIQHLAQRIAFHGLDERKPVVVDAAGYRARRTATLHGEADQAVEAALRHGHPVSLEPMGAQERKIVHEYLKARSDVETYSEGQEPNRRLVVAPLV